MESKGNLIAAIVVIILILSVVLGTILYLTNIFKGSINLPSITLPITNKETKLDSTSDLPRTSGDSKERESEIFDGGTFRFSYPKNWGLLTCTTSKNIELDPTNPQKIAIPCDFAVKPVTILVNSGSECIGEQIKIGNYSVTKSKKIYSNRLDYRWCLKLDGTSLEISHRVSSLGSRATSKDDFSADIEKIIATLVSTSSNK